MKVFLINSPQSFEDVHNSQVTNTVVCIYEVLLGALALSLVPSREGHHLATAWFIAGCCPLHLEMLLIALTTWSLLGSCSPF